MSTIAFGYHFRCADGEKQEATFNVELDAATLQYRHRRTETPPAWAELTVSQCRSCPLKQEESPQCPAALVFVDILDEFGELLSFTEVEVTVTTRERTITSKTSVQRALSSLVGLCMATSGCPILARFKPMARFHLPVATREETMFRSVGAYLLAQYFLKQRGNEPDMDLKGLRETYDLIHQVNVGLANRLREIPTGDAHLNAIVILDLFAHALPSSIDEGLAEIEHMFTSFIESGAIPRPEA
ncbi:MAG TPA: hypothetical protein PLJ47_07185 [Candidatus Hydrogenedentes bacterium]|nr:hypothetical protein [Candidatus Hydrogenedentota bacterium]HRK34363.1 hypothetical protein [Candidatus Hydrogenedentota bacterium]